MKIKEIKLSVRELSKGFVDNEDQGVFAYEGKLDIRPPYQREFVYKDKQRDAVINTVMKNFPLNIMYWAESSRNIPKKRFLYSMPYYLISFYLFARNVFFTLFSRLPHKLRDKYYLLKHEIKEF